MLLRSTRGRRSIVVELRSASSRESHEVDSLSDYRVVLRKEVIQPQVPLRLPCYDFTPITDHTFGACLPCGLAQRLLVQPAFVV